jgi:hypothetical protein
LRLLNLSGKLLMLIDEPQKLSGKDKNKEFDLKIDLGLKFL